jgi:hypothetical protein
MMHRHNLTFGIDEQNLLARGGLVHLRGGCSERLVFGEICIRKSGEEEQCPLLPWISSSFKAFVITFVFVRSLDISIGGDASKVMAGGLAEEELEDSKASSFSTLFLVVLRPPAKNL